MKDTGLSLLSPERIAEDHVMRSEFVRTLILREGVRSVAANGSVQDIVQFSDDSAAVPGDVQECIDSWKSLDRRHFRHRLFDDVSAGKFIRHNFDKACLQAFKRCQHPAMRADYFRLCFIATEGGVYVDADDVFSGLSANKLMVTPRLKLNPLCYDLQWGSMCNPLAAAREGRNERYIFYVNNNPLIASRGHPVVLAALERAKTALLSSDPRSRDVQSLTGPGNLTATLVEHAVQLIDAKQALDFQLLRDWESVATSRWPLAYRTDDRNWRVWAQSRE